MTKRILYLSHRIPYPPNKGDKIRSFNQINYLAKENIVDLITFADEPGDMQYAESLKEYCNKVTVFELNKKSALIKGALSLLCGSSISQGYFYQKRFQDEFDKWTTEKKYDAIYCFSSPMAEYVFKKSSLSSRIIMDFCDLDSDKWLQYAMKSIFPLNLVYRLEARRLLAYEKQINRQFDVSIFVSQNEARLFHTYFPRAKSVKVLSNGVDHDFFNPERIDSEHSKFPKPLIVFSGAMDYHANVDGVIWFSNKIFPIIKKHISDAHFYIVGSNPDKKVLALESIPGIHVTGFVEDIREYYKAADVIVTPLRIARGVQNKVLEAMAMKKAIVTTSNAVQGIRSEKKLPVIEQNSPDGFAQSVCDFLLDKNKRNKYGDSTRKFVLDNYTWEQNMEGLDNI